MQSTDVLRVISEKISCVESEIVGLMDIPVRSLALDKVEELHRQIDAEQQGHDQLMNTTVETLFIRALDLVIKSKDFS